MNKTNDRLSPISKFVESTIGGKVFEIPWLIAFLTSYLVGPIFFLVVIVLSLVKYFQRH